MYRWNMSWPQGKLTYGKTEKERNAYEE